ncbi:4-coumarate--CoA ligase-like 3 [Acorus calamus]|uniref:4-coumarate--CoA ligase-like 3 n=1 Tax=Acorus calamus TaxID=4465 RepID=A0AAV9FKI4_ACOCL|nr:4-coumarate--CoA ligase-like 3 [Acorus calamus]
MPLSPAKSASPAPTIAFAASSTAASLPPDLPVDLIDSDDFQSMFIGVGSKDPPPPIEEIWQSDTETIQFSYGTTGRSKATMIPHQTFIAMVAEFQLERAKVKMVLEPMFYMMGFALYLGGALGETTVMVSVRRFKVEAVAVAEHGVTVLTVAPPILVALERAVAQGIVGGLETLRRIIVGGAPLSREAVERFIRRFRHRRRRRRRRGEFLLTKT